MNISRKIALAGAVTLGVFGLGSAGAAAVAHTLTIEDRAGAVQKLAPVTTGTMTPSPSATPLDDKSNGPTGTTTVSPADPINVDDHGGLRNSGTHDGAPHDLGDDNLSDGGHDGTGDPSGDDHDGSGDSGTGTSGSGGSTSGSGVTDGGSSGGSGHGGGSGDTGGHH